VTDKGVPAALVMATTRSLLRGAAEKLVSPGKVLAQANDLLCPDIPRNMFVTCLYMLFDPASGHLVFANAGHNLPYKNKDGQVEELRATGMPLGLMSGMAYEEVQAELCPGENVLLFSDGLVEAHNPEGEMFGFPRLKSLMANHAGGQGLIETLVAALGEFTGDDWEQEDDVTLVVISARMWVNQNPPKIKT
jgi:serine phosphatase RsbU (regulator of sigma subunit)